MIVMANKKDILIFLSCLGIIAFFIWGMAKWPDFKKGEWGYNLYYVCMCSCIYATSLVLNITAQKPLAKIGSALLMAVFGMNLYIELFKDPTHWTHFDMLQLAVVTGITLFIVLIIEKLKSWKK